MPKDKDSSQCINLDTQFAKSVGFTSDKFRYDSYMWKDGKQMMISLITSNFPGKGNFINLVDSLEERGYNICVPEPSNNMRRILHRLGFVCQIMDYSEGKCEIMSRPFYTPKLF